MRPSFALPALLLAPFALAATTAVKTTSCSAIDLKTFNGDVKYGQAFCEFWLIVSRNTSPLPDLAASSLTNVCQCVVSTQSSTSSTSTRSVVRGAKLASTSSKSTSTTKSTEKISKRAVTTSKTTSTKLVCVSQNVTAVQNDITHPIPFCNWWATDSRTNSPIPGLSASQHASINSQDCVNVSKVIGDILFKAFEQFEQEVVFQRQKLEHENFGHSHSWSGFILDAEKLDVEAAQLIDCNII
ncbi:hypothetical protein KCU81_g6814, partial [Aureobasidium melanogenum]